MNGISNNTVDGTNRQMGTAPTVSFGKASMVFLRPQDQSIDDEGSHSSSVVVTMDRISDPAGSSRPSWRDFEFKPACPASDYQLSSQSDSDSDSTPEHPGIHFQDHTRREEAHWVWEQEVERELARERVRRVSAGRSRDLDLGYQLLRSQNWVSGTEYRFETGNERGMDSRMDWMRRHATEKARLLEETELDRRVARAREEYSSLTARGIHLELVDDLLVAVETLRAQMGVQRWTNEVLRTRVEDYESGIRSERGESGVGVGGQGKREISTAYLRRRDIVRQELDRVREALRSPTPATAIDAGQDPVRSKPVSAEPAEDTTRPIGGPESANARWEYTLNDHTQQPDPLTHLHPETKRDHAKDHYHDRRSTDSQEDAEGESDHEYDMPSRTPNPTPTPIRPLPDGAMERESNVSSIPDRNLGPRAISRKTARVRPLQADDDLADEDLSPRAKRRRAARWRGWVIEVARPIEPPKAVGSVFHNGRRRSTRLPSRGGKRIKFTRPDA